MVEKPKKRLRKVSGGDAADKPRPRRSAEGLKSKKESDRRRDKTRISIGVAFPGWRALKEEKGLRADTDVALLLLSIYEKYTKLVSTSRKAGGHPQPPPPPSLSSGGTESQSYEKRSSILMISTGTCMQESTSLLSLGHLSASESCEEMEVTIDNDKCNIVQNRESDLHSDVDNVSRTAELSVPGADDSCDEEIYVPVIPQRSKMSEFLLECEEEELEPWQKQTSQVHFKDEDDVGELSIDQTDCKPDPASLQTNATPPKLKEESPQPVVFSSQGFIVASPQLTSNTESIGSPANSLPIVTAGQQQLFQKVSPAAVTPEAYGVVHTSEVQQISNNPLSLSSVQSPAVYPTPSDQTNSQTLSVPFPLPCYTILELQSTNTTNTQQTLIYQENTLHL